MRRKHLIMKEKQFMKRGVSWRRFKKEWRNTIIENIIEITGAGPKTLHFNFQSGWHAVLLNDPSDFSYILRQFRLPIGDH